MLLHWYSTYCSQDTMAESSRATSTLTSESIYHRKKEERAQQYLSGSSRAAYHLDLLLQWSLSMLDISQGSESGSEGDEEETFRMRRHPKRRLECKWMPCCARKIPKSYESFGKHTGKTASTGGAVIQIRRILKDYWETSLVSVLIINCCVLHGLQTLSLSLY